MASRDSWFGHGASLNNQALSAGIRDHTEVEKRATRSSWKG
jgi:hypothetical protein